MYQFDILVSMSHGKREFEGDINTIEQRILKSQEAAPYPESGFGVGMDFDFLRQIQEDYGIRSVGNKTYELEIDGIKHQGTLAYMFEVLKGESKPGASE